LQERIDFVSCNAEQSLAFSPFSFLVTAESSLTAGVEILFYFACGTDKIDILKKTQKVKIFINQEMKRYEI